MNQRIASLMEDKNKVYKESERIDREKKKEGKERTSIENEDIISRENIKDEPVNLLRERDYVKSDSEG